MGEEKKADLPPGVHIRRERESHESGDLLKYVIASEEENASVCYVALMRELVGECGAGRAYIYNNTTYSEYRRKGYAAALTRHVFSDLEKFAIKSLFTSVPVDNISARKLYEALGFTPGEESVEMELLS